MFLVGFFKELARQHKGLNAFYYGEAYEKGAGNAVYPLMWLDDPIYGNGNINPLKFSVNVDFLDVPKNGATVVDVQGAMFEVGLATIEKINNDWRVTRVEVSGFSFLSLRDYYDDGAAGYRFTLNLIIANPTNRCADYFDPGKQFPDFKSLPNFSTEEADGCAVFNRQLPNFKIKNE